ncbi:MAG: pitrilysin family protein [Bacteroidales bacterium]|nr:pitrilysin family protein [Bacteroidales bacterium]
MTEISTLERFKAPELKTAASLMLSEPPCMVLPNGIPVYTFNDQSQEALRFDLLINAGSGFQQKKLVAGSTIKMLREGSKRFTAGNINAKIDYHGAYLDLQSSKDIAWMSLYCLGKSLPLLMPLIESMLKNPSFRHREFRMFNRRQKQEFIVSSRINKHLASRIFNEKLFGTDTPYGQTAAVEDFDKLATSDLAQFHAKHFLPANCTIIVSGPINDKIIQAIEKHFGDHWSNAEPQPDFIQETIFESGLHQLQKPDSLQSSIMMGRPVMQRNHPDYFGFLFLNTILGGYFGSRLMNNIREDKGYTYGIHSQVMPYKKACGFVISTEVGTDVTNNTLDEIKKELFRLQDELVDEEEMNLVRNYLNGTYLRALDGVFNQAEKFRTTLDNNLGMEYFANSLRAINTVTADELKVLAVKYFNPSEMLTVLVGNLKPA